MMEDKYIKKFRELIKKSITNEEIDNILNKVYEDGFFDGHQEKVDG